tara:strand:- start:70 stop:639 length:570 start_codon:yes stop_codon:yes gene_type:complete
MDILTTPEKSAPSLINRSFESIYKEFYSLVRRIAFKYNFSECCVDDIAQQVFITAWRNLHSLRDQSALSGWIATIAKNTCLREVKLQKRRDGFINYDKKLDLLLKVDESDQVISYKQTIEILENFLQNLPSETIRERIARMYYLEHRSLNEICTTLNLKHNTVLSHLRRFRLAIAKPLTELIQGKVRAA